MSAFSAQAALRQRSGAGRAATTPVWLLSVYVFTDAATPALVVCWVANEHARHHVPAQFAVLVVLHLHEGMTAPNAQVAEIRLGAKPWLMRCDSVCAHNSRRPWQTIPDVHPRQQSFSPERLRQARLCVCRQNGLNDGVICALSNTILPRMVAGAVTRLNAYLCIHGVPAMTHKLATLVVLEQLDAVAHLQLSEHAVVTDASKHCCENQQCSDNQRLCPLASACISA